MLQRVISFWPHTNNTSAFTLSYHLVYSGRWEKEGTFSQFFFFREVIRGSGWFHIQFFVEFDLFRLPLKTFFPPKTCVNVCLHIFPLNMMWKCEQMAQQMNQKRKSTHTLKEQAHKISLCIYINITWVWMWSVMADLP